jgi:hypothetical protein
MQMLLANNPSHLRSCTSPLDIQLNLTIPRRTPQRNKHTHSIHRPNHNIKQHNPQHDRQDLLDISTHRQRQRTSQLIRLETRYIE